MYMDDIKVFTKKIFWDPDTKTMNIQLVIEFGTEKCEMLIMKSTKRETTVGIRITNQERIRTIVMFWPFDPAKNAIQGDAPEGSDAF